MAKRPIVGVMVTRRYLRKLTNDPLTDANLHFQAARRRNIQCYFFSITTPINSRSKTPVHGWTVVDGTWTEQLMPLPDVVYQRTGVRKRYRKRWRKLVAQATKINSVVALNKWRCHAALQKRARRGILLPDTIRYLRTSELLAMLHKHQSVMVKPDRGSRGFGIVRIDQHLDGSYSMQTFDHTEAVGGLNQQGLLRALKSVVGRRRCIVQQYIPLLRVEGRVADVRVMVNKDGRGIWVPVVSRLRIGPPDRIVSNYHQGGELLYLRDGLKRAGVQEVEKEARRAERTAIRVAKWLEQELGPLGETGIDLGFDENLRVWFIEANGMPDKVMPPHEYNGYPPDKYQFVMDYAEYLWQDKRSR